MQINRIGKLWNGVQRRETFKWYSGLSYAPSWIPKGKRTKLMFDLKQETDIMLLVSNSWISVLLGILSISGNVICSFFLTSLFFSPSLLARLFVLLHSKYASFYSGPLGSVDTEGCLERTILRSSISVHFSHLNFFISSAQNCHYSKAFPKNERVNNFPLERWSDPFSMSSLSGSVWPFMYDVFHLHWEYGVFAILADDIRVFYKVSFIVLLLFCLRTS